MQSSSLKTEKLIQLIHQRPALWDRNCKAYQKRWEKEQAWKEICEEFVPSFSGLEEGVRMQIMGQLTTKWYNVRDSYVKSLKGHRRNRLKRYVHSDILSFLDPIYAQVIEKNTEDSNDNDDVTYVQNEEFDDKESDNDTKQFMNEVYLDIDEDVPAKLVKTGYGKRPANSTTDDTITNIFANLIEREEDEDRAFFNSITPTVKQLSRDAKLEFKIQVLKLLRQLSSPVKVEKDPIDSNDVDE